jgi:hypothetical protein
VRIYVSMVNPKALEGQVDDSGPFSLWHVLSS